MISNESSILSGGVCHHRIMVSTYGFQPYNKSSILFGGRFLPGVMVTRLPLEEKTPGSSPGEETNCGSIPKWSNGADCKSAGLCPFYGSNPYAATMNLI